MLTDLAALPAGVTATVVAIQGGHGMRRKVEALGIRPGKCVTKVSTQFMAGPVTVQVDARQVAMGRGIARRISVETA